MSLAVRRLLRALRAGVRPGAKTTGKQLDDLAELLTLEADRRRRGGAERAVENGADRIVWTGPVRRSGDVLVSDGDRAIMGAEDRWGEGAILRVTVERVA